MSQHCTRTMQQTALLVMAIPLVSCLLLFARPVFAAEYDCSRRHEEINTAHSRLISNRHDMAPSLYNIKLMALEDELFEAFEHCPGDVRLLALMGELQITNGQPSLAAAYGNKILQLDASSWRGHYIRGTGLCLSGQCDEGLSSLREAINLQPANSKLRLHLCSVLVWNGMYEEGVRECGALIRSGDSTVLAKAYYLRSRAYSWLGDTDRAESDRAKATQLGFDEARDLLPVVRPESIPPELLK